MNLIEQLGGYEQLKGYIDGALRGMPDSYCYKFDTVLGRKKLLNMRDVKYILLEYRRQHNIYEVGDKVVIRKADGHPDLFTYESISKSGNMHFFESPFNYAHLDLCKVRHATDAEIKAGKRL